MVQKRNDPGAQYGHFKNYVMIMISLFQIRARILDFCISDLYHDIGVGAQYSLHTGLYFLGTNGDA